MPHVNIKHFPAELTDDQESDLVVAVTAAVIRAFGVDESVVSIALEPVDPRVWDERVRRPEIVERKALLRKAPGY